MVRNLSSIFPHTFPGLNFFLMSWGMNFPFSDCDCRIHHKIFSCILHTLDMPVTKTIISQQIIQKKLSTLFKISPSPTGICTYLVKLNKYLNHGEVDHGNRIIFSYFREISNKAFKNWVFLNWLNEDFGKVIHQPQKAKNYAQFKIFPNWNWWILEAPLGYMKHNFLRNLYLSRK